MLSLGEFTLEQAENRSRQFIGDIILDGRRHVSIIGVGNGPLSAALAALHAIVDGALTIREYSEHSIGEGTGALAASYVELLYELPGSKKTHGWGVASDTDITGSGIKAVLTAVSKIGVVINA